MATVRCPNCSYKQNQGFFGKFMEDLPCPNCGNQTVSYRDGYFDCSRCKETWSKVPCPKCGTGINAASVR